MNKPLRLSVSCIKTYCWSKSKFAWSYILWVKDTFENDSLALGKMFEEWLVTGKDNWDLVQDKEVVNSEKFIKQYDALKFNARGIPFKKWDTQVEVKGELFWHEFIWYIDNLTEERVEDIKTICYLSKPEDSKNDRSGMNYQEEYELQIFLYLYMTWRTKWRILEVSKFPYKNKIVNQVIEFHMTDEWKDKMLKKLEPIITDMYALYDSFTINKNE